MLTRLVTPLYLMGEIRKSSPRRKPDSPRRGCRSQAAGGRILSGRKPAPPHRDQGGLRKRGRLQTPQGFAADAETYAARTHKELAADCPA